MQDLGEPTIEAFGDALVSGGRAGHFVASDVVPK
jgi:hypothetical protein